MLSPAHARRAVVLFDGSFDVDAATQRAIDVLSRNPKGYFLMVESDTHTETVLRGLDRVLLIDKAIRRTVERAQRDTLVLFTADHSYDFRVRAAQGRTAGAARRLRRLRCRSGERRAPTLRRDDSHTGEEVLVAAQGPGADRVRGFLINTDLFRIMMDAYGWSAATGSRERYRAIAALSCQRRQRHPDTREHASRRCRRHGVEHGGIVCHSEPANWRVGGRPKPPGGECHEIREIDQRTFEIGLRRERRFRRIPEACRNGCGDQGALTARQRCVPVECVALPGGRQSDGARPACQLDGSRRVRIGRRRGPQVRGGVAGLDVGAPKESG